MGTSKESSRLEQGIRDETWHFYLARLRCNDQQKAWGSPYTRTPSYKPTPSRHIERILNKMLLRTGTVVHAEVTVRNFFFFGRAACDDSSNCGSTGFAETCSVRRPYPQGTTEVHHSTIQFGPLVRAETLLNSMLLLG